MSFKQSLRLNQQFIRLSSTLNQPKLETIKSKLENHLKPVHCLVINESNQHNVPKGSETHFRVLIVSSSFDSTNLVNRHRKVNQILDQELKSGVHALAIEALTPIEWEQSTQTINSSPKCLGGSKK